MSKLGVMFAGLLVVCGLGLSACSKGDAGTVTGSKGTTAFFPVVGG